MKRRRLVNSLGALAVGVTALQGLSLPTNTAAADPVTIETNGSIINADCEYALQQNGNKMLVCMADNGARFTPPPSARISFDDDEVDDLSSAAVTVEAPAAQAATRTSAKRTLDLPSPSNGKILFGSREVEKSATGDLGNEQAITIEESHPKPTVDKTPANSGYLETSVGKVIINDPTNRLTPAMKADLDRILEKNLDNLVLIKTIGDDGHISLSLGITDGKNVAMTMHGAERAVTQGKATGYYQVSSLSGNEYGNAHYGKNDAEAEKFHESNKLNPASISEAKPLDVAQIELENSVTCSNLKFGHAEESDFMISVTDQGILVQVMPEHLQNVDGQNVSPDPYSYVSIADDGAPTFDLGENSGIAIKQGTSGSIAFSRDGSVTGKQMGGATLDTSPDSLSIGGQTIKYAGGDLKETRFISFVDGGDIKRALDGELGFSKPSLDH